MVVAQVKLLCPESVILLQNQQILKQTVHLLSQLQQLKVINGLGGLARYDTAPRFKSCIKIHCV